MLYYDFHIHSALSPCADKDMTPNNIVNMAALCGLNTIAISDHNCVGNVKSAMKVGKQCNVNVIAGMEIETAEEIHILTLYPSYEAALEASQTVYQALPDIKNRPDIFGDQFYMDEDDQITGIEEKLLISPTSLSIEDVFDMVKRLNGLFIPAHVDRHSYSILTNLGFIPDHIGIENIEISNKVTDLEAYLHSRPDLTKYNIYRNSDAHYLEDLTHEHTFLECEDVYEIFRKR